jgi:hypothetical protein
LKQFSSFVKSGKREGVAMRKSSMRTILGDRRSLITNLAKLLPQNQLVRKHKAAFLVEEIAGK